MEKQIIARDRQEVRASDQNDMQTFAQLSIDNVALDGVGDGKYYSGLDVTAIGPTEVQIAPGRFWSDGKIYAREENLQLGIQALTYNLFQFLPTEHEKAIAAVVYGQEQDTNVEPRDFLVDLVTRATEPQAVPMRRMRLAVVSMIEGIESPQPQVPPVPGGVLHFCTIYLGPTGIVRIEMVDSARVPSAAGNRFDLESLRLWQLSIAAQIETLRALLAEIRELISRYAPLRELRALAVDVGRLKERLRLPSFFSAYDADQFNTTLKSDPTEPGYSARVEEGLLFPTDAQTVINMALLSPTDSSVQVIEGKLYAKFITQKRFGTVNHQGDMPLAYEQQSFTLKHFKTSTYKHIYGWSYNTYVQWWAQKFGFPADFGEAGMAAAITYSHLKVGFSYNWTLEWNRQWRLEDVEHQYLAPETTTIVGALVAQTFLSPAGMWMTAAALNFTKIDTTGDVTLTVCKVSNTGEPLLEESLVTTTIPRSQLKLFPEETRFSFQPVFLSAGTRYALVIITQGAHRVATVSGEDYTQGTLFYSTSGAYFEGDATKDLLFSIYAAKFNQPRVVVALQPLSLAGGISDIEIDAPAYRPDGCSIEYEIQVGGLWRPFAEPIYHLASLPDVVPLRAVLQGTTDVMPMIELAPNSIMGSRAKLALTHLSTLRTLPSPSDSFTIYLITFGFIPGSHTLTAKIVEVGGTERTANVTEITAQPDGSSVHAFEFSLAAAISSYRIKTEATRSGAAIAPFVVTERMDVAA